jgi:hypothetical protein
MGTSDVEQGSAARENPRCSHRSLLLTQDLRAGPVARFASALDKSELKSSVPCLVNSPLEIKRTGYLQLHMFALEALRPLTWECAAE